jgi:hypothetical protein
MTTAMPTIATGSRCPLSLLIVDHLRFVPSTVGGVGKVLSWTVGLGCDRRIGHHPEAV